MAINNTVMFEKDGGFYVYKETGRFFEELLDHADVVDVFQISMPLKRENTFANYCISNKGLRITNVRRGKNRYWAYFRALFKGISAVFKADFVYLFYPGPICAVFACICIVLRKDYGIYVRGEQGISSKLSRFLYSKAGLVFTISPKFTDLIREIQKETHTIRPMVDITESDFNWERNYESKSFFHILYVGRIVRDKGLFELVESIKMVEQIKRYNFVVHLVGNGPDLSEIQKVVFEAGLERNFIFHGMVSSKEELKMQFKMADIFVLPSHHEGFPRVIYEAMAYGTPIITTFVGTIPYLMKDKINCYRIQEMNPVDLAGKLLDLMDDYGTKAAVARQALIDLEAYLIDKQDKHAIQLVKTIKAKDDKSDTKY